MGAERMEFAEGPAVRMALAVATAELRDAGCDTPRLDAELLLADAMGTTRTQLHLAPERELTRAESDRFAALLRRRRAREPVAYVLGTRAFRYIELKVDDRVLVPRPESEGLVEAGLKLPTGARVVDVGTGSGAIALALKDERPDLAVTASDISPEALAAARANAARLGLDVAFAQADLVPPGAWDVIVSNPPYVADGDELGADVRAHEPPLALFAGADGLDVLRRLVAVRAPLLVVEVGAGQAAQVAALARAGGYAHTQLRPDLAGIDRVVVAWG